MMQRSVIKSPQSFGRKSDATHGTVAETTKASIKAKEWILIEFVPTFKYHALGLVLTLGNSGGHQTRMAGAVRQSLR